MPLSRDNFVLIISFSCFMLVSFICFASVIRAPQDLNPLHNPIVSNSSVVQVLGVAAERRGDLSGEALRKKGNLQDPQGNILFNRIDTISYPINDSATKESIATNDRSSIDTLNWYQIKAIRLTESTTCKARFLLSFDNRITWKTWNGHAWDAVSLINDNTGNLELLYNQSLSKDTLDGLNAAVFMSRGGFKPGTTTNLDIMEIADKRSQGSMPCPLSVFGAKAQAF